MDEYDFKNAIIYKNGGVAQPVKLEEVLELMSIKFSILYTGGRDLTNRRAILQGMNTSFDLISGAVKQEIRSHSLFTINGAARGVDSLSSKYSKDNGWDTLEMPSDWDKYGNAAGCIRNGDMLKLDPDIVIAFWNGKSTGTADTIKKRLATKKPMLIFEYQGRHLVKRKEPIVCHLDKLVDTMYVRW